MDGQRGNDTERLRVALETVLEQAVRARIGLARFERPWSLSVSTTGDELVQLLLTGVTEWRVSQIVGKTGSGDGITIHPIFKRSAVVVLEFGVEGDAYLLHLQAVCQAVVKEKVRRRKRHLRHAR